jgi:hypothetical protein
LVTAEAAGQLGITGTAISVNPASLVARDYELLVREEEERIFYRQAA